MSRKGEKQVILPFEFKFSNKGVWGQEFAITLKAPALADFAVHNRMVAFTSKARTQLMRDEAATFSMMPPATIEALMKARADYAKKDEAEEAEAEKPEESDSDMAERVMGLYASGLGDAFPEFVEFLKKALTNNARLASIGDTKQPVTDLVWDEIDKNERGGLEAINMILAGFANFFLSAQQSRSASESGEKPATGSSSDTRAALN